ncbi:MAG TPA: nucleotide sugar dehydrogenase [Candidatus Bathyarchaeia archaeon]|nr:nucleotide sugar dehydrogenase [Candidatus Bathyarchaeia archaeon]
MLGKIVVVGMGYAGIPIAALFADTPGFTVVGVQRRSKRSGWKIDWLNEGKNPIGGDEPGLSELISRVVKKGAFKVVDDISTCRDAEAVLIDVQTPTDVDKTPNYDSLKEVSETVGKFMSTGTLVVVESTVAPGTTDNIVKPILEKSSGLKAGKDFYLAFCYERVMVGRLIKNMVELSRIVGGVDEESTKRAMELYSHIVKAKLFPTDALTAEVTKVVENTYRDVNIAFANEVALICESLGVDVFKVRELVNTLPNDSSNPASNPIRNMHYPGAGVGGHCLPKDGWLLKYGLDAFGKFKLFPKIIVSTREVNDSMPRHVVDLIEDALAEHDRKLKGAKVAILGVAFLENCDDTRNTPSAEIYSELRKRGAQPILHDPIVRDFDLPFTKDLDEALSKADAVVISTKHKEYLKLDLSELKTKLATPVLVDGRNAFDEDAAVRAGLTYRGVGKGTRKS